MNAPASTCGYCGHEGTVSLDQTTHTSDGSGASTLRQPLLRTMRFHCSCGNEWLTGAAEAEAQGRFLDQAGLR